MRSEAFGKSSGCAGSGRAVPRSARPLVRRRARAPDPAPAANSEGRSEQGGLGPFRRRLPRQMRQRANEHALSPCLPRRARQDRTRSRRTSACRPLVARGFRAATGRASLNAGRSYRRSGLGFDSQRARFGLVGRRFDRGPFQTTAEAPETRSPSLISRPWERWAFRRRRQPLARPRGGGGPRPRSPRRARSPRSAGPARGRRRRSSRRP